MPQTQHRTHSMCSVRLQEIKLTTVDTCNADHDEGAYVTATATSKEM